MGTFSLIHFLSFGLNSPIFWQFFNDSGNKFQPSEPRKTKLLVATFRSIFSNIIFPYLLSLERKLDKYSGSLVFLILNTLMSEWYDTSWFTVSQSKLLNIWTLGAWGGEWETVLAALFCKIWISFRLVRVHPPNRGKPDTEGGNVLQMSQSNKPFPQISKQILHMLCPL